MPETGEGHVQFRPNKIKTCLVSPPASVLEAASFFGFFSSLVLLMINFVILSLKKEIFLQS